MGLSAEDLQTCGKVRIVRALDHLPGMKVINSFAHPSHKPLANQFYLTIDGYDYLVTVEFQDPR